MRSCVNLDSVFQRDRPFIDGMFGKGAGVQDHQHLHQRIEGQFRPVQLLRRESRDAWIHKKPRTGGERQRRTVNNCPPGYLDTKMVTSMSGEVVSRRLPVFPWVVWDGLRKCRQTIAFHRQ